MGWINRGIITFFLVAVGIILLLLGKRCAEARYDGMAGATRGGRTDSVRLWRDEAGRAHARAEILELQRAEDLLRMRSKDSLIERLQELVRKEKGYGKRRIVGAGVAAVKTVIDTVIIASVDTVYAVAADRPMRWDSVVVQRPNFNGCVYIRHDGRIDSTRYRMHHTYRFSGIIRRDGGLVTAPRYSLELVADDPNVTIVDAKSVRVEYPRERRFGIGPMVGVGISYDGRIHPIVGIGLQWNVIRF